MLEKYSIILWTSGLEFVWICVWHSKGDPWCAFETSALVLLLKFSCYDCLKILKLNIMFLRLYRWVKFACFSLLLLPQLIMILMYRLDEIEQRWHLPRAKSYHSSPLIMLNGRTGNCWDLEQLEVPRCRLNSMTKTSGRLFFLFMVWGLGYPLSIKWKKSFAIDSLGLGSFCFLCTLSEFLYNLLLQIQNPLSSMEGLFSLSKQSQ